MSSMRSPNTFPVGTNATCEQPGDKPVAHRKLIETIAGPLNGRDIRLEKVKSHSGHASS